jgi:two-component system, NtrC family, sensor histidine kinase KinB
MRIKTKVALGVAFLFFVIITVGGLGLYYLSQLSGDAKNILTNNYESLVYTQAVIKNCDSLFIDSLNAAKEIERNISLQEQNITEPGERLVTAELRQAFEKIKNRGISQEEINALRRVCLRIQDLNMQAIVHKNEITQETASQASTYVVIIVTIFSLIAFSFIINFPGYVANPIVQLTQSIKLIAGKKYEERLHFDRKDEFEELAAAFNQMAEKLDEYEHSNLANVLFEKKRIETIINRMSDPVIGLDNRKKVVFANDQALLLLNLTAHQMLDRYAPDVAVENDLFRTLIKANGQADADPELIKIAIDGKENYFSKENITIRYNPTGEKETFNIGQVILLKNVTPYKQLDLAKTNFIATISHELKTPIASLQMCIKLLQDTRVGLLNKEQQSILQTLNDETSRLSKLTNELLDLSQVETGNIKLDIKKTDPKRIVNVALEAVKFQSERKNVKVEARVAEETFFLGDAEKTTWVLVNLLTNAIRYSPENSRVILTCENQNGGIKFSIEDFGPGIEKQYLSRLFEKFFQVPGSASGTGLGLAITKEFIEAQGGTVAVASEIGKGSIFSFELPIGG